jgi:hypothetical protein
MRPTLAVIAILVKSLEHAIPIHWRLKVVISAQEAPLLWDTLILPFDSADAWWTKSPETATP